MTEIELTELLAALDTYIGLTVFISVLGALFFYDLCAFIMGKLVSRLKARQG